jgi:hypothetical protein
MVRSPPFRVYCHQLNALFGLAFAAPPSLRDLGLLETITRRLIIQKAGSHSDKSELLLICQQLVSGTISLP